MNRLSKAILGLVTLAAPIIFIVFLPVGYANISEAVRDRIQPTLLFRRLLFTYMIACFLLIAGYLVHAWKVIPAEEKRFWLVALLLLNIFALPVYWYRFLWKRN